MGAKNRIPTSSTAATKPDFTINDLDDYSLSMIFNKLPHRARVCIGSVCKRWCNVSEDSWCLYSKHLTISRNPNIFPCLLGNTPEKNGNILEKILKRRGYYLEEITFERNIFLCQSFEPGTIKRISEYCPKLKRMNAGIEVLNAEDFYACSNLQVLSLTYYSDLQGGELRELFRRNKRLRRLEISVAPCKVSVFDHLDPGQLEILHIIYCDHLEFTAELADKLSKSLVELKYKTCPTIPHNFRHLSKLRNLRSLTLKIEFRELQTQFIVDISKNCQKLERLTLALFGDDNCNQNHILMLFTLPCLRSLVIILTKYRIPYKELNRLFREANNLKFFVLSSCAKCVYEEDNVNPCYRHVDSLVKNTKSVASDSDEAVIITAA